MINTAIYWAVVGFDHLLSWCRKTAVHCRSLNGCVFCYEPSNFAVLCVPQTRITWRTAWCVWLTHLMCTSLVCPTCDRRSKSMPSTLSAGWTHLFTRSCCSVGWFTPSPLTDSIWAMVIVSTLRGKIIRTASAVVHDDMLTNVSSSLIYMLDSWLDLHFLLCVWTFYVCVVC